MGVLAALSDSFFACQRDQDFAENYRETFVKSGMERNDHWYNLCGKVGNEL